MPKIKSKIFQSNVKIISNREIAPGYYRLLVQALEIAKSASPGQFVNIRVSDGYEPLLRRPFSIHRIKGETLEILYKVVGKATEILSGKKKSEHLDILGPLGNGYSILDSRFSILVAGGVGVAPLLFLAEKLVHSPCLSGRQAQSIVHRKILVLLGAKTKNEILCDDDFQRLGCEVRIATEDGSKGYKGKATDLLRSILSNERYAISDMLYACGPKAMLGEIAKITKRCKIPAQGSLEAHMACGIGACMGCVIKIKNPCLSGRQEKSILRLSSGLMVSKVEPSKIKNDFVYQRVCYDGPVFDLDTIKW